MTAKPRDPTWAAKTANADVSYGDAAFTPEERDADALLGTVVSDRYRITGKLGEGAMGVVYTAEHLHLRKRVALKVLHAEMSAVPDVVARFEREAVAASRIHHPNVVEATDFGLLPSGAFFLALEFLEGKTLRDVIDEAVTGLGVMRALRILRQVALGVERAHELNIVHRDLKPDNVMLIDRDGDRDFAKVLDFGIARVPMDEVGKPDAKPLTRIGMVYGTPEYMAPEQAMGLPVDARADVYALGILLFEMLTGVRPFRNPNLVQLMAEQITAPVPRMIDVAAHAAVPAELESFVRMLLEKDADKRPATATGIVQFIDTYLPQAFPIPTALPSSPPLSARDVGRGSQRPPALTQDLGSVARSVPPPRPSAFALRPSTPPPSSARSATATAPVELRADVADMLGASTFGPDPWWARLPIFRYVPRPQRGRVAAIASVVAAASVVVPVAGYTIWSSQIEVQNAETSAAGRNGTATALPSAVPTGRMPGSAHSAAGAPRPTASAPNTSVTASAVAPGQPSAEAAQLADILNALEAGRTEEANAKLHDIKLAPGDRARVEAAMARGYFATNRAHEGIQSLTKLYAIEPTDVDTPVFSLALLEAATAPAPLQTEALSFLEQKPTSHGVDALYELAYVKTVVPATTRRRALSALTRPQVLAHCTETLKVALDLRQTMTSCMAIKYFTPAAESGDARALVLLKELLPARTITGHFHLHKDNQLQTAIAAIEKRLAKR
jgi:eukaryotic-like serine/threonine-protein kinase